MGENLNSEYLHSEIIEEMSDESEKLMMALDSRANSVVHQPTKANRARFNVSGTRFETFYATLEKYPDSLLGSVERRKRFYDEDSDEFFLDRNPDCFKIILSFYQSDKLCLNPAVDIESLAAEISYFDLTFYLIDREVPTIDEKDFQTSKGTLTTFGRFRKTVWEILEKPQSSKLAFCFSVTIQVLILLSILIFIIESLPQYHVSDDGNQDSESMIGVFEGFNCSPGDLTIPIECSEFHGVSQTDCVSYCLQNKVPLSCNSSYPEYDCQWIKFEPQTGFCRLQSNCHQENHVQVFKKELNQMTETDKKAVETFQQINYFCIAVFTIEIVLRLISTPQPRKFFLDPLNIIDLLAVLPFYIELVILQVYESQEYHNELSGEETDKKAEMFRILRIIRLIRVVRILRFSRYNQNLQTLGRSLIKSTREIGFLIMFYLIFSVLCATIAYYVENEVKETGFTSIPSSLWWAIVTMTTVGYGDMYPQTAVGRFIGCIAVFCGILCVALPIPFISNAFELEYKKVQIKSKFNMGEDAEEYERTRMRLCMHLFELQMEG